MPFVANFNTLQTHVYEKILFQLAVALIITLRLTAQNNPLWLRYPAISPDGKTIVFSYKGELQKKIVNG